MQHTGTRIRAVVLDDCDGPRETYKALIRKGSPLPVDVLEFSNGDEAWRELSSRPPHLFITDCLHAGRTCAELFREILRTDARFPIFVISASFQAASLLKEFPKLALQVFEKPFDIPFLAAAFAEALRAAPTEQARLTTT